MDRSDTDLGHFEGTESLHENAVRGGSLAESLLGIGAVILAIIGLIGLLSEALLAVSTIVVGAAFLIASGTVASRFNRLIQNTAAPSEMTMGMTTEFVGGLAGIVLGVLSLLGVAPGILLPAAALVFGFTLLFGISVHVRLSDLECRTEVESERRIVRDAVFAGSGVHALIGIGAMVLGILGIVTIVPITLSLVAMLSVGSATLLRGLASSATVFGFAGYCEMTPHTIRT